LVWTVIVGAVGYGDRQAKYDLKTGLHKTVKWYLENIDWLNAIIEEKDYQNWVQINYQRRDN